MYIKIANKKISDDSPVFIIAEAGINHNGDVKLAKQLVDAAIRANADAIKFQTFTTELLVRRNAPKAEYQNKNIGKKKSQYRMLKELELNHKDTATIKQYCKKRGIIFLSTPYDFASIEFLEKIKVPAYKLASMDVVTHPLIKKIAQLNKPLILSTGMATEKEIRAAVKIFSSIAGNNINLILLQCNTDYPSRLEEQNLKVLNIFKKYTPFIGFSDHTIGNIAAITAVALGAKVIERHFTLDKHMPGPDHKASLNPGEFAMYILDIRKTEVALGKKQKKPTPGELKNIISMRRSICAKNNLAKGSIIKEENLTYKRPGNGLNPTQENINKLVDKKAIRDIAADENILPELVK